jgi:hypothetical protein
METKDLVLNELFTAQNTQSMVLQEDTEKVKEKLRRKSMVFGSNKKDAGQVEIQNVFNKDNEDESKSSISSSMSNSSSFQAKNESWQFENPIAKGLTKGITLNQGPTPRQKRKRLQKGGPGTVTYGQITQKVNKKIKAQEEKRKNDEM